MSGKYRGLYISFIMHRYGVPQTDINIALHRGLYLTITVDWHEGPQTPLL
jgi:hypothetical protein